VEGGTEGKQSESWRIATGEAEKKSTRKGSVVTVEVYINNQEECGNFTTRTGLVYTAPIRASKVPSYGG